MAAFVVALGISPTDYYRLTRRERDALARAINDNRR